MKYITAIKASFIAFILFILASVLIPGKGPSNQVELFLTLSTFLFAIFSGFFIARLNSRYEKMRDLVANEDAYFLSFYNSSIFFGEKFKKNIGALIDKYYLIALDSELGSYYKANAKCLEEMYSELDKIKKLKNNNSDNVFDGMVTLLCSIETVRNNSSVLTTDKLTKGHWVVLISLATITIYGMFYLKTPEFYSQLMTILLSTILVLVLFIIRDLQNFRLTGQIILEESAEEVLESIGKTRYYHEKYLKEGTVRIPDFVKQYRLGTHKIGEKQNIKIVRR